MTSQGMGKETTFTVLSASLSILGAGVIAISPDLKFVGQIMFWCGIGLFLVCISHLFKKRFGKGVKYEWKIITPLDPHPNGNYFFKGYVYNPESLIKSAFVRLTNFTDRCVQDRYLQRKGGDIGPVDLPNGGRIEFDIAIVSGNPNTQLVFIGYEGSQRLEGESVGPGIYDFTLQLFGHDVQRIDHRVRIRVKAGGGQNCVDLLFG
jgi:hypothetical protein